MKESRERPHWKKFALAFGMVSVSVTGFQACTGVQGNGAAVQSHSALRQIQPADLAIVLDPSSAELKFPLMRTLSPSSYETIVGAFDRFFWSNPLRNENEKEDWRLVSVRVVPCVPRGAMSRPDTAVACWPELRLVFQPILENFNVPSRRPVNAFADDRAIHVLYDVKGGGVSESSASRLLEELAAADRSAPAAALSADLADRLQQAQAALVPDFLRAALGLRQFSHSPDLYSEIAERPEYAGIEARALLAGLSQLIHDFGFSQPKIVTAFSLPEGRGAAEIGQWMFVRFGVQADGELKQEDLVIRSKDSSKVIARLGKEEVISIVSLESQQIEALKAQGLSADKWSYLRENTLLESQGTAAVQARINNPFEIQPDHTSCSSCHRLNPKTPFNFHNLSYFEDFGLEVADRVINDVAYDRHWLQGFLSRL